MRTIKISQEVWEEIAKRGKFGETEDDVLRRIFNIGSSSPPQSPQNTFTLRELLKEDLSKSKPKQLIIGQENFKVTSWADLCISFVRWLKDNQLLPKSKIPIYTYSRKEKYFINDRPEHSNPNRDACWKNVGDLYVDVKYASDIHVKNIISTLNHLQIPEDDIKIAINLTNVKK